MALLSSACLVFFCNETFIDKNKDKNPADITVIQFITDIIHVLSFLTLSDMALFEREQTTGQ